MERITVLGNGPSKEIAQREEYELTSIRIGCNFVEPEYCVTHAAFVDAHSAKYLKDNQFGEEYRENHKLIFSKRCIDQLESFRASTLTGLSMARMLEAHPNTVGVVDMRSFGETMRGHASAGHVAFIWAIQNFPEAEINLLGFDSFFTNDHSSTTSARIVREDEREKPRIKLAEKGRVIRYWDDYWQHAFTAYPFKRVIIWGYEGDEPQIPPYDRVEYRFVEKPE